MNVIGMSAQEINHVFQMVASVLHIGNITFYEDNKSNAVIGDQQVLEIAANMLQVSHLDVEAVLWIAKIDLWWRCVKLGASIHSSKRNSVPRSEYGSDGWSSIDVQCAPKL